MTKSPWSAINVTDRRFVQSRIQALQNTVCGLFPGRTLAHSTEQILKTLRLVGVPIRVMFKYPGMPKLPANAVTSVAAGRTFDAAVATATALEVK